MIRSRIEHAHAVLIDVLRDLDIADQRERRVFEECLAAARRLGQARDLCHPRPEGVMVDATPETEDERLLQVA